MAVNKVVYGDNTLIDLTEDTVTAETLAEGVTAHDAAGNAIVGTMAAGGGGDLDLGIFEKLDSGEITTNSTSNVTIEHNLGVVPDFSVVITRAQITSPITSPIIINQIVINKTVYNNTTKYAGNYTTRYINSSGVLSTASGILNETAIAEQFTDTAFLFRTSSAHSSSTAKTYVWFCGKFKEDYAI